MTIRAALVATVICAAGLSAVRPASAGAELASLAREAISADETQANAAIAALRDAGPAGLKALNDAYPAPDSESMLINVGPVPDSWKVDVLSLSDLQKDEMAKSQRIGKAFDAVGQQLDNRVSRLYWHTNLAKAKEAARAEGKPILELRLLGRLTELYSCANSRFFRSALYPQPEISKYLRENYVLYWQMVRPVPRVTIDFGDGRRIETTITGNSIHYILDSEGQPLEALPGMVAPKPFLRWLTRSNQLARRRAALNSEKAKQLVLRAYHQERLQAVDAEYKADLAKVAAMKPEPAPERSVYERRALTVAAATGASAAAASEWARIAQLHLQDASLGRTFSDARGLGTPTAVEAAGRAMSKISIERPMLNSMLNFQKTLAEDTVFNEYALHPIIHQWFIEGKFSADIDTLNSKVYAELFLTPDSDPWLGLKPQGVFTGLPDDGVVMFRGAFPFPAAASRRATAAPPIEAAPAQMAQNVRMAN